MISKITESNEALINARLEQINEALRGSENSNLHISNLEEYFAYITEISALATSYQYDMNSDDAVGKFLLMPIDEPIFEIDANARTIKVPDDFKKNGIGVRGDHNAETLYFAVDRYYDYQDLFDTKISIYWQFRGADGTVITPDEPAHAFAPDNEYIPGKIVFGWIIDNAMTPTKGVLTFSVSFAILDGVQWNYTLNTQTASVNINDTLPLVDPSVLAQVKYPTLRRLTNSRYTPIGLTPLENPSFATDLPSLAQFAWNNNEETDILTLTVTGNSEANTELVYRWNGNYFDDNIPAFVGGNSTTQDVVSAGVFNADIQASKAIKQNYARVNPDLTEDSFIPNVYYVKEADSYVLAAEWSADAKYYYYTGTTYQTSNNIMSQSCLVPWAAVPQVSISLANGEVDASTYKVTSDEAEQYIFVDKDSSNINLVLSVEISKDETAIDTTRGLVEDSELGLISLVDTNNSANILSAASRELTRSVTLSNNITEGNYSIQAINERNHTQSISAPSNEIQVSYVAPNLSAKVNVSYKDGQDEEEQDILVPVIVNNALVQDFPGIKLGGTNPDSRELVISVDTTDWDNYIAGVGLTLKALELKQDLIKDPETNQPKSRAEILSMLMDEEQASKLLSTDGNDEIIMDIFPYTFVIDKNADEENAHADYGWYVIEAITDYRGTQRVAITDVIKVSVE